MLSIRGVGPIPGVILLLAQPDSWYIFYPKCSPPRLSKLPKNKP